MRINRFYSPTSLQVGMETRLDAVATQHAVKVLRLPVGAPLVLFDGNGGEYTAELIATGKTAQAKVLSHKNTEHESPLGITLVQALARGERMDYIIQKAVELGVTRIIPVISKRSVIKLDTQRAEKKRSHWQGVIRAACEQCGRNRLPVIDLPVSLENFLADNNFPGLKLVLTPAAEATFDALKPTQKITLLIGPEGGLTGEEIQLATQANFIGLQMGPRILRTETAGVAALSSMQTLWGDMGS